MSRHAKTLVTLFALLGGSLAGAGDAPVNKARASAAKVLKARFKVGDRFTGTNSVSYSIKTTIRQGRVVKESTESIKRTEVFEDKVLRDGRNGVIELARVYRRVFTRTQTHRDDRPQVHQSPMKGRAVTVTERRRRRSVKAAGRTPIEPLVRKTLGMEIDWRDILPKEAIEPGSVWEPEVDALARRLAAYLDCGHRSRMRVRYEEDVSTPHGPAAKLYVDWEVEGMRDKRLFTKVTIAGDVLFVFDQERVVSVDLAGTISVRGAIIGVGDPQIVKGEGPVSVKMELEPMAPEKKPTAAVEAAAAPEGAPAAPR